MLFKLNEFKNQIKEWEDKFVSSNKKLINKLI